MTRQVLHFLETYQRETHDSLPPSLIREAKALYQQALPSPADKLSVGEAEAGVAAVSAVTVQLREVLEVIALGARKAWATFDEPRMACGALLLLSSAAVAAARVRRRWCLGREGCIVLGAIAGIMLRLLPHMMQPEKLCAPTTWGVGDVACKLVSPHLRLG